MSGMYFSENAADPERKMDWQKIAEITDADFGFTTPKEKLVKPDFA